jgi:hypothetical protein
LVSKKAVILEPVGQVDNSFYWGNPAIIFPPLALLAGWFLVQLWCRQQKKLPSPWSSWSKVLDFLLFLFVGILGLLIVYLDYFSLHSATKNNLNILWLFPGHLVAAFIILWKRKPRWMRIYWLIFAIQPVAILALWPIWPQGMHVYMIAPMLLVACRSASLFLRWRVLNLA